MMQAHNCNHFDICVHSDIPNSLYQQMDSPLSADEQDAHDTPRAAPYGRGSGSVTCYSDSDITSSYPRIYVLARHTYSCGQRATQWLRQVVTSLASMGNLVSFNCIHDLFINGTPFMVAICIFTLTCTMVLLIRYVSWGFIAMPFLLCFVRPRMHDEDPQDLHHVSNNVYLMVIFIIGVILSVCITAWFCWIPIMALFMQFIMKLTDDK